MAKFRLDECEAVRQAAGQVEALVDGEDVTPLAVQACGRSEIQPFSDRVGMLLEELVGYM